MLKSGLLIMMGVAACMAQTAEKKQTGQVAKPCTINIGGPTWKCNPGEVTVGGKVKPFDAFWSPQEGYDNRYIDDLEEYLPSKKLERFPKFNIENVAKIEFLDFSPSEVAALKSDSTKSNFGCGDPVNSCYLRKVRVTFRGNRKPLDGVFMYVAGARVMDREERNYSLADGDIKLLVFK